jgi:hypothetical protein
MKMDMHVILPLYIKVSYLINEDNGIDLDFYYYTSSSILKKNNFLGYNFKDELA